MPCCAAMGTGPGQVWLVFRSAWHHMGGRVLASCRAHKKCWGGDGASGGAGALAVARGSAGMQRRGRPGQAWLPEWARGGGSSQVRTKEVEVEVVLEEGALQGQHAQHAHMLQPLRAYAQPMTVMASSYVCAPI